MSEFEFDELSWQEFPKDSCMHVLTNETLVSVLAISSLVSTTCEPMFEEMSC